jgi:hypothetical protein
MNRLDLVQRTQSNLRDFGLTAFREIDVVRYINEGIERVIQIVPQFDDMVELTYDTQSPIVLPKAYHHLLSVYASARLFAQDDRFHQSATLMNEFEIKMAGMYEDLMSGDLIAYDVDGNEIDFSRPPDYVRNEYFLGRSYTHEFRRGGVLLDED